MAIIFEVGKVVATSLVPPRPGDPEADYRWRVTVAILLGMSIMTQIGYIAWACGFLASFGANGFAMANEVQQSQAVLRQEVQNVGQAQKVTRVEGLDDAIYQMRKEQCLALSTHNREAASLQEQRIRTREDVYRQLTGLDYVRPTCDFFADPQ